MITTSPRLIALAAATAAIAAGALGQAHVSAQNFSWHDEEGEYRDLLFGDRPVARYMYEALDTSSDEARERTYKPFHHIFDWDGEDFITKGAGGRFTHHRGIYHGFNQVTYTREDGSTGRADTWHARGDAYQEHIDFIAEEADATSASLTTTIGWHGENGEKFATEERTLTFSYNDDGDLVVDFKATLSTDLPKVVLDGDAQHAGVQFRAHNDVDGTSGQSYYIRPDGVGNPGQERNPDNNPDKERNPGTFDLDYHALSFVLGDDRYSVGYFVHDDNPRPSWHSERAYGRFGSYFITEFTKDEPLTVQFRFIIRKGEFTQDELAAFAAQY